MRVALVVTALCTLLTPETGWNLQGGTVTSKPVPTLTFTWSWSTGNPPFYSIAMTPMGSTSYKSFPNSDQQTGTPYTLEFTASRGLRTRISSLIQQLNFLRGKYKINQNPSPAVPSKSLTYSVGSKKVAVTQNQIIYTSTKDRRIAELTKLFEEIGATVNTRRVLETSLARNADSLTPQLVKLEARIRSNKLLEPQILAPTLQQIASNSNVPQAARQRAQSMLRDKQISQRQGLKASQASSLGGGANR